MLHNLAIAMAYHSLSGTDIPGFLWCAERNTCRSFGGATHCCASVLSFFAVLAIATVLESTLNSSNQLNGTPGLLSVVWFSLSVCLNVTITTMICFRIMRMRMLIRDVLSPDMSTTYTSMATMLIESAVPFSILGIGLIITVGLDVAPKLAFAYVWSAFCVESESFCVKDDLLNCLPLWSVSLPSNDHPPGLHGLWVAQRDGERLELGPRIRAINHCPRVHSGRGDA